MDRPDIRMADGHHGMRHIFRRRGAQIRHAAALHQAARAGMAFSRRDLLAVDGLLLHDQRASTGRLLHGADDVSRQGLGGADRLPHARAPYMALVSYYSMDFVEASYW